ncbi:uncharacterized protein LOC120334617 isoform X2 [Styela clava]
MTSPSGNNNHVYFVRHRSPRQIIQRSLSVGGPVYNRQIVQSPSQVGSTSSLLISASPPQAFRLPMSQSQRFSPYPANRRARCNSDVAPSVIVMPSVIPINSRLPRVNVCQVSSVRTITPNTGIRASPRAKGGGSGIRLPVRNVTSHGAVRKGNIQNQQFPRVRLNAEKNHRESAGIPSSSFYNGGTSAESDFSRFLKATCEDVKKSFPAVAVPKPTTRKRLNLATKPKKAENVCITISSDSEDDAPAPPTNVESTSQNQSSPATSKESSITENGEMPPKKIRQDDTIEKPETSTPLTSPSQQPSPILKSDEALSKLTLNLSVDSVRLGQMKLVPKTVLRISHESLSMTAFSQALQSNVILTINWKWIISCDICTDSREPCIFLVLTQGCLPTLRATLNMVKGKFPYYDPDGKDDERLFIFYISATFLCSSTQCNVETLLRKVELVRKKMKKPSSFFRHITFAESELRQSRAAASMETSVSKTPTPTTTQQATSTTALTPTTTTQMQTRKRTIPVIYEKNDESPEDDLKFMFTGPRIELFVYPPPPTKGGISVSNADQFCLNEGEFLNDVIIEFYLKYVYDKFLSPSDRERTHMFSCFFYERLMQRNVRDKLKNKDISPAERRHNQVKKWTRNVDIFSKDYLFIPINEASHWYIAVICFPGMDASEMICLSSKTTENMAPKMLKTKKEEKKCQKIAKSEEPTNQGPDPASSLPSSMQYLSFYGEEGDSEGQGSSTSRKLEGKDQSSNEVQGSSISRKCDAKDQSSNENQRSPNSEESRSSESHGISPNLDSQPGINTNKRKKLILINLPNFKHRKKIKPNSGPRRVPIHTDTLENSGEHNFGLRSSSKSPDCSKTNVTDKIGSKDSDENSEERLIPIHLDSPENSNNRNILPKSPLKNSDHFINGTTDKIDALSTITMESSLQIEKKSCENVESDIDEIQSSSNSGDKSSIPSPSGCHNIIQTTIKQVESCFNDQNNSVSPHSGQTKQDDLNFDESSEMEISRDDMITKHNNSTEILKVTSISENSAKNAVSALSNNDDSSLFINNDISIKSSSENELDITESENHSSMTDCNCDSTNDPPISTNVSVFSPKIEHSSHVLPPTPSDCSLASQNREGASPKSCSDEVFELYVSPEHSNVTLSKELEQRCIISPNRKLRVQLPRVANQSPMIVKPIIINSTSSLSSDCSSVIVLSSDNETFLPKSKKISPKKLTYENVQHKLSNNEQCSGTTSNCESQPSETSIVTSQNSMNSPANEPSLHLVFETSSHELSTFELQPLTPKPDTKSPQTSPSKNESAIENTENSCPMNSVKCDKDCSAGLNNETAESSPNSAMSSEIGTEKESTLTDLPKPNISTQKSESVDSKENNETDNVSNKHSMAPENGADNSNNNILSETKFNDSKEHNLVVENASQRTDVSSQAKTDNKSDVPTSVTSDSGNSVASEVTSGKEQHKESITVYKRPCILVFDSLRGPSRSKIAASLREYLTMEWKTRKSKSFGTKVFDKDSMRMCSVVVPQQDNYTDCGLFLLHYFEKFFRAPIQSYAPPIKILDWFDPDECKTKREEIKKVIDDLHEEWKKKEET